MVNTRKLKGRIRELGLTQEECAKYLHIKAPTFNQKLNNIRHFSLAQAEMLSKLLNIEAPDFPVYFFTQEVA